MLPVSVLWLTGAPGVGKSTVGWALYTWARADNRPVAYVDIDQLGLLAPAPTGDLDYHQLKATNLLGVLDTFRRHGARQLIVSGVVNPHRGIAPYIRESEDFEFTLIRLSCTREELRRRYLERGSSDARLAELMSVADALDRNAVGSPLDTTSMSPRAVVHSLADQIRPVPQVQTVAPAAAPEGPPPPERTPVLLLVGPTAVGKSSVGWEVLQILWGRGIPAAYVDVDQLGFYGSDVAAKVKAENLSQVWRGYRLAGARALVVVARGAPHRYEQALANERVTVAYLEASPSQLAKRIAQRGRGHGPRLAGDSLIGASAWQRTQTTTRSAAEATALRQHRSAALVIDTNYEASSAIAAKLAHVFRSDSKAILT